MNSGWWALLLGGISFLMMAYEVRQHKGCLAEFLGYMLTLCGIAAIAFMLVFWLFPFIF